MSAKWRALQHRHRYTYSAVIFPHSYLDSLTQLTSNELSQKFCHQLKQFASLKSIYAQVNHVKSLSTSFNDLLLGVDDANLVSIASRLYLELLFLENSLPLHKTLLSVLSKNRKFWGLIGGCFRQLCEEYGALHGKGKRFCVSRVALSMMSTPKLGYLVDVVDECCVLVALDVVAGLNCVVAETNGLARPSPIVMEQCQEALSCMYYLLQRFPSRLTNAGEGESRNELVPEDSNLSEMVVSVILSILKSTAFSRDCFVAAGVSFCAALQVWLSPQELGYLIMEGVFERKICSLVGYTDSGYKNARSVIPYRGDFCFELRNVSPLSRLCFIRGVLTAVSRVVLNFRFVVETEGSNLGGVDENGKQSSQSILYDCILPELCHYCENPSDSHFNFHALTVMQICLQQIKTSILADLDRTTQSDPISEDLGARVLRIIWNNLEDPLSQTVKQVHLVLDLFLDIKATIYRGDEYVKLKSFLGKIAADLLCLGARCKGRYVPLASLTKRLGAKTLLGMNPKLLFEVVQAYVDDDVCSAATSFLKCFLQCLRDECWDTEGVDRGYEVYRGHCLPPFLYGLASGVSKLRSNLNTYALPSLLEVDVDSIFPMLSFLSISVDIETGLICPTLSCLEIVFSIEQKVAVLVSLLKVSRSLQLFEGDVDSCHNPAISEEGCMMKEQHALIYLKGIQAKIPAEWLVLALTHVDESLRVDASESLFLNPKTASLPSTLELNLMRISVPLNMRCCSTAFQMKWGSLFRKFFSRVRTALERQIKQGNWQPSDWGKNESASLCASDDESTAIRAENLYQFMKWLSAFLFFSCYPSAPYERKIMAMELIMIMVNVWSIVPPLQGKCEVLSTENLYIISEGLTRPASTMLLVGSIIDSWDRLRESSFRILLNFPTPLPGISSESKVQEVILWAKTLVCSPRVRESDAGALALRLIFRKYVLELGWIVGASVNVICHTSEPELPNGRSQKSKSRFPIILYITSLIEWLQAVVEQGEKDLLEACQNSFVHGVLLALRYTFEELDWNSDVVTPSIPEMRDALGKLLQLVMRITSLALWVVSSDALCLPQDMDDIEDDGFLLQTPDEIGTPSLALEHEAKDLTYKEEAKPTAQIVMVGCWLAMKEVSLLLGTIIRKIPLPTATSSIDEGAADLAMDRLMPTSDAVLDVNQLEAIGNHFLEVLFKMKHNGAIDKTRAGFTALCNRLLCSDDPRLCQLTESWMEQLMERTVAKGQTVDDLLRRSAGIPAAFSAFFLSEPQGAPKKLLQRHCADADTLSDVEDANVQKSESDAKLSSAKIRVEGVIPTVHAFNVLKAAFNDANLATDTSGFAAEAMIISIRSFSSPHWEIRNSACLHTQPWSAEWLGFLMCINENLQDVLLQVPSIAFICIQRTESRTEWLQGAQSNSNLASIVHQVYVLF
ncbi:Thyroid adenoma-associated protein-like protein [Bienertia sinuspersici]